MQRRDFLTRFALAGLSTAIPWPAFAQRAQSNAGRIDVHHHYLPPFIEGPDWAWSADIALEAMDRNGVATAILSGITFPEPLNDRKPAARALARRVNEYAASFGRDHPGRFGFFASLPLADTDGSLQELAYALDVLGADGIVMNSSAGGMWPGDPSQMPVFEELHRRKAIVFLHPTMTPFCCRNPAGVANFVSEYDNDVNRAVLSLLWNGVLTKYPGIDFILAHSGGTVPALAGRIQDRVPQDRPDLYPYGALDQLRRLYFEIGHASFPWVVAGTLEFAGPSQLLFGTDFPREPHEVTTRHIPALKLPPDTLHALNRGNAERLFPRFAV